MAVFRVERTRDYTVMCNHHLKDSNLSLKAKGLLSMMLSLPDEWNYTTRGLAAICKEGVDAIGKTLKELELAGYIIRRQLRGKDGRISDTEYTIFEKPRKPSPPDTTLPDTENPYLDNPDTEAPDTDNPAQLNTKKSNTQKSNTDLSSTHSFFLPAADGMTDGFEKKAEIREQIEYDILCQQYDRMQLDELVEIMLEVAMNRSPTVKLGGMRSIPPASCNSALKRSPPCTSKRSWTVSARTPPAFGTRKPISWRRCSIPFPPSTTTMPCWSITIFTAAPKGRHFSCPIPGERI